MKEVSINYSAPNTDDPETIARWVFSQIGEMLQRVEWIGQLKRGRAKLGIFDEPIWTPDQCRLARKLRSMYAHDVQPGEGGNRQDEPASPDIDPGHAAQFARLRQVEAPQESGEPAGRCTHWIQDSSPSDWITADCRWNEICPSIRGGGSVSKGEGQSSRTG